MKNNKILIALIAGVAFVMGCWFLSNTLLKKNKSQDVIGVTGLASENFTSDLIVWSCSFSKKTMDLKESYKLLKADREKIIAYMKSKGLDEKDLIFSSVSTYNDYEYTTLPGGASKKEFLGFLLSQSLRIESKNVEKVEKLSREVTELIDIGVELQSEAPQYYYTKLSELKIKMIANATKDARNRAEKIATNAKSSLGKLKQADLGIFQITAQNSSEEYSWGGTFNTSSKEKTASITVNLSFETK
ncbi:MAG: SIMPL domain-containing protein [Bacteroidetes bacterium]|nr:SIMPL domain-containing protein [Bacteroidota bacterium]